MGSSEASAEFGAICNVFIMFFLLLIIFNSINYLVCPSTITLCDCVIFVSDDGTCRTGATSQQSRVNVVTFELTFRCGLRLLTVYDVFTRQLAASLPLACRSILIRHIHVYFPVEIILHYIISQMPGELRDNVKLL